jgi:hypothetical protein
VAADTGAAGEVIGDKRTLDRLCSASRIAEQIKRPAEAGRLCYLRIAVARLLVRLFGILIPLAGRLALLARFLTAALLLTRLLTRRLILLAGLVLVRHVVSFHGNIITTDQSPRRSDKRKMAIRIAATM